MNKRIESATRTVKKTWDNSKGTIAVVSTATAAAALMLVIRNQNVVNQFLDEHGLMEEFYAPGLTEDELK